MVGITAFTSNINRAYEISQMYRKKKIKVIMGGIHISMLPNEALQYADTVVTGEVEGVWKLVIDDFENNRLLPKYNGPLIDLLNLKSSPGTTFCIQIISGTLSRPLVAAPLTAISVQYPDT